MIHTYLHILFIFMLTFSMSAFAADGQTGVAAVDMEACQKLHQETEQTIERARSCWENTDCEMQDYGCGFQLAVCHRYPASKSEPDARAKALELSGQYRKECITPIAEGEKRCVAYDAQMKNAPCVDVPLVCVNGRCVTQTEVILQNSVDSVDSIGSRQRYIPKPAAPLVDMPDAPADR
ncbi:MAG: hypothetical protein KDD76_07125 [Rickettsiales bacterium]|nr:hypothetical protein [Rickettsiales bacterium]